MADLSVDQIDAEIARLEAELAGPSAVPAPKVSDPIEAEIALLERDLGISQGGPSMTGEQVAGRGLYKALQGLTFGYADEFGAAGNAAIDKLIYGNDFGKSYDQYLGGARDAEKQFDEAHPYFSTGAEVAGALLNPIDKLAKVGTLGKAAIEGGLYGFGSGEGGFEERAINASKDALMGAGTSAVLSKIGTAFPGFVEKSAPKIEKRAAGITAADEAKAVKGFAAKVFRRTGESPIDKSMDTLRKHGIASKHIGDPGKLMMATQGKIDDLYGGVRSIVNSADEALDAPLKIDFTRAENAIKRRHSLTPDQANRAIKTLRKEVAAFKEGWDGSLTGLQRFKEVMGDRAYASDPDLVSIQQAAGREIQRTLKNKIESVTNGLAKQGKLPKEVVGKIKELNSDTGDLIGLIDIFKIKAAKDNSGDWLDFLQQNIRTSGGWMSPVIATAAASGAGAGLPAAVIAGAAAHAATPQGRAKIAKGLRSSVDPISKLATGTNRAVRPLYAIRSEVENSGSYTGRDLEIQGRADSPNPQTSPDSLIQAALKDAQQPQEHPGEIRAQATAKSLAPSDSSALSQSLDGKGLPKMRPAPSGRPNEMSSDNRSYPYSRQNIVFTQQEGAVKKNSPELRAFISEQPPVVQAIIKVESAGDPKAQSRVGAQGLMQLMPAIQKAFKVQDPFDVRENVRGGKELLQEELDRFKDLRLALAAYNAGSPAINRAIKKAGGVRRWEAIKRFLPKETRLYVPKVEKALAEIQGGAQDDLEIA